MNLPTGGSENLYKYITVLGAFVVCTSIYAIGLTANDYGQLFREVLPTYLTNPDIDDEIKQVWAGHLQLAKKNADITVYFLFLTTLIGAVLSFWGGSLWYLRIQRPEDEKRQLQNKKLIAETPKTDKKEIIVADD